MHKICEVMILYSIFWRRYDNCITISSLYDILTLDLKAFQIKALTLIQNNLMITKSLTLSSRSSMPSSSICTKRLPFIKVSISSLVVRRVFTQQIVLFPSSLMIKIMFIQKILHIFSSPMVTSNIIDFWKGMNIWFPFFLVVIWEKLQNTLNCEIQDACR